MLLVLWGEDRIAKPLVNALMPLTPCHQKHVKYTFAIRRFTEWIDFYLRSIKLEEQSIQMLNLLSGIVLLSALKLQKRSHLACLSVGDSNSNVNWLLRQKNNVQLHLSTVT